MLALLLTCMCSFADSEDIFNYPISTNLDMATVNASARAQLTMLEQRPTLLRSEENRAYLKFLPKVIAFTSNETVPGERYYIVNFAQSDNKAIRRLRDEIHLKTPSGGAIVRIYPYRDGMPRLVRSLFGENVGGVTWGCRFVAIEKAEKSETELQDTISHELAHAYITSSLGLNADKLPKWFHEGVALWLSDSKDAYILQTGYNSVRTSWSPKDYQEYRTVFRYLEATIGRDRVDKFIENAVEKQSVEVALKDSIGSDDYNLLRSRASEWWIKEGTTQTFWVLLFGIALFASSWFLAIYKQRADESQAVVSELEEREFAESVGLDFDRIIAEGIIVASIQNYTEDEQRNLEKLAQLIVKSARAWTRCGNPKRAFEKLEQALKIGAWSILVQEEVQSTDNERRGLRV